MPKGSLIGCGVIAALLTIAFLFWIPFGGAERSDVRAEAQKVLRLIRNGQTSAISGHFSTAPQLEIDWTTIEADIKELDLTGYVAWQETELRNHSSPEYGYTLEGNATAQDGRVVPLTMEFVQDYPFWKLRSIRRSSPNRAQPTPQPKKNAATGGQHHRLLVGGVSLSDQGIPAQSATFAHGYTSSVFAPRFPHPPVNATAANVGDEDRNRRPSHATVLPGPTRLNSNQAAPSACAWDLVVP